MNEPFATGAHESPIDYRTIEHPTMVPGVPLVTGGKHVPKESVLHQHKEGICTSISLVQKVSRHWGKKYSPDFQYLMQKRKDGNWTEGSSIFYALKVGKNIGFLPAEHFPVTEADRDLPYPQYAAKLQAISEAEIERLITLCEHKLTGYAIVNVSAPEFIAKAIDDSEEGILCRYEVDNQWWTPSWLERDINPLRAPVSPLSGHAIEGVFYDFVTQKRVELANTWGPMWCRDGSGDAIFTSYRPTEAWIPYFTFNPDVPELPKKENFKWGFFKPMLPGARGDEVTALQTALMIDGCFSKDLYRQLMNAKELGFFGGITRTAVIQFQTKYGIAPVGSVGPVTRAQLNRLFNN